MPSPSDGRKRPGKENPIDVRTISISHCKKALFHRPFAMLRVAPGTPRQKVSMIGISNDLIGISDQKNDY
jgi:hypothetical protein